jgi:hypothetical protein
MTIRKKTTDSLPCARPAPHPRSGLFSGFTRAIQSWRAKIHPAPIIVLGNQKSGTTAIAALLAEATGLSVTLDLKKEFTEPVIDGIKSGDLTTAAFVKRNKLDFSRDVIKEPSLSVYYPELVSYFPDARFVMVIRDPRDNIRSILNRLRVPGTVDALTEGHRSEFTRAWELIIDGGWLGIEGANHIETLAQRWNYIADLYLENEDQIILLQYETFLNDKAGEISRLADTFGLEVRFDISHRVDHQFQPAGDHNVSWADFYGPVNLARIESICRERMRTFGYAPSM